MDFCDSATRDRFMNKVMPVPNSGCWLWIGGRSSVGYGMFFNSETKKLVGAHRVAYEARHGKIGGKLFIDHLCRVPCCVNPDHMEAVAPSVNIRRGNLAAVHRARADLITHCPYGHPYSGENLRISKKGCRHCRQCDRERRKRS